jgi:hypothetical protein
MNQMSVIALLVFVGGIYVATLGVWEGFVKRDTKTIDGRYYGADAILRGGITMLLGLLGMGGAIWLYLG